MNLEQAITTILNWKKQSYEDALECVKVTTNDEQRISDYHAGFNKGWEDCFSTLKMHGVDVTKICPEPLACDHNEMVETDEHGFAWKCAKCGYIYGK